MLKNKLNKLFTDDETIRVLYLKAFFDLESGFKFSVEKLEMWQSDCILWNGDYGSIEIKNIDEMLSTELFLDLSISKLEINKIKYEIITKFREFYEDKISNLENLIFRLNEDEFIIKNKDNETFTKLMEDEMRIEYNFEHS